MAKLDDKTNKWYVENIHDNHNICIEANPKQGVFISKIKNSVVTIKGKSNTIVIDNAVGSGVVFDDVISTVEVINSKKLQLQANGAIPSISIDKTEGSTVILSSPASRNASIVTSLSSEVNIVVSGDEVQNIDDVEYPVPQQFVSKLVNGKLVTKPSEHV